METDQLQRLREVQQQMAAMVYHHREGGRYAYVFFLSLLRDLPVLLRDCGPEEHKTLSLIAQNFNERLCHRFTVREEAYFELSRNRVLRLIVGTLSAVRSGVHPAQVT